MRQEMINLLKSATPFVGDTGKAMIQLATYLNDLLSSDAARKTAHVFSTLNPPQTLAVSGEADVQSLEDANPFGLFLILILLIMATGSIKSKQIAQQKLKENTLEDVIQI